MAKGQPIPDIWYRLDDSAVIYPINITMATQSLFRLTCELDDYVDEEYLLAALTNILPRFPTFNVQLRSGIFRHFFDHNPYPPVVREDDGILFKKINFIRNHYYLFRTTYFKKRISIDFFHALSDGTGAMVFMKGLVFEYLRLAGLNVKADNSVKLANEEVKESERGDGFLEYGVKYKLFGGVIGKMVGAKAYQIKGKH
ncbi:MAG: hypothetical protein LBE09_06555, partial [Christensenellaceae bacterium]|nr:hypothetical protein [Christensenellaceae bacterium]